MRIYSESESLKPDLHNFSKFNLVVQDERKTSDNSYCDPAQVIDLREKYQAELGQKCKITHSEYPVSFQKLNKTPKIVKPSSRQAKEIIVLPYNDSKIYKFQISKDALTRHLTQTMNFGGHDPHFKELNFKHPIYHMDYNFQTQFGVFFSKSSDEKYSFEEESEELLQLNFFDINLSYWPTDFVFSPLTRGINHSAEEQKNFN